MITKNPHSVFILLLSVWLASPLFSQLQFSEITKKAGITHHYLGTNEMGAGAAFFDMDNDGDEDLWLSGGLRPDALYENDGQGNFTDISEAARLLTFTRNKVTTGVITGDVDNDGYKDVLLITHIGFPNTLLKNNGDQTFQEMPKTGLEDLEAYSLAAAFGDVNQDGYLDIYAGHYIEKDRLTYSDSNRDTVSGFDHQCHANQLYLNNGDWTFTNGTAAYEAGDNGCALATLFTDYDGDFDPDILVANDFGQWITPNALLENQQDFFNNVSESSQMNIGIYGMGIATGDYDNDLDLDYYITNLGENVLLKNNGNGTFSNHTLAAGIGDSHVTNDLLATGWGTAFIDLDNDTDLDLYVVNGYVPAASFIANARANPNSCYENDGTGNYTKVVGNPAIESPNWGRGLAYADIDNDGDLDFLVGNVNKHATSDTTQQVQLFRNDTQLPFNWLKIKLEGTRNNRDGLGSQIRIKANGRWYLQEANGGYGTHASQHSSLIHFGLGTAERVDSLIVFWQGGQQQIETQIAANQLITIKELSLISNLADLPTQSNIQLECTPNPFEKIATLEYQLENKTAVSIDIFDGIGRRVFHQYYPNRSKGTHQLEWLTKERGIYFIRLYTDEHKIVKTVLSN